MLDCTGKVGGMKPIPFPIADSGAPLTPEHRSEWINESNSLIPGSDELVAGHSGEKKEERLEAESIPDMGRNKACSAQGGGLGTQETVYTVTDTTLAARVRH